ncbi:hypothetical protein Tco_1545840 [Tanacetum coccineum]
MDTTRAQQKALDDDLEPTLQVVLDALKLTSFYKAFKITADVPEIYMQEFWVTASRHHSSLCFKMNGKSHTVNVDNFRDMLHIFPKLPGQKFEDPPFEEEILFLLEILDTPGMYHNKNVDYVYLMWEDLVYQVEIKNSKKNNDMCYPGFTKVIVDYFMTKDLSIPRRNKMFWHTARDDPSLLESEAYKTYHAYATGEKNPKPKYVKNKADPESSPKKKSAQASKGNGFKSSTKVAKPAKKKQPTTTSKEKGLNVLFEKSSDEDNDDEVNMSEDDDDQDDDNEQTELDNDDDDFVHPKLVNVDGEELDEEETNKEDEVNELYRDVNVNLEGRDTEMTDAP